MELSQYTGMCSCGKCHHTDVEDILIGADVLEKVPSLVEKQKASKVFLLQDIYTQKAVQDRVTSLLTEHGIPYSEYTYKGTVVPDEYHVGKARLHFDPSCDLIAVVGSGTLNDIGKIMASISGKPYIIIATAPSMDGFASASSSMIRDNLKVSISSVCPCVVVCDIDILKEAPLRMIQSGIGDIFAKYISICEWRISHVINGEYYCPKIADLIHASLKSCAKHAEGLMQRDPKAIQAVTEGLVYAGIAMQLAGVSRPASGMEHYFSHIWDMRSVEFGTPHDFHGIQCAVATAACIDIYEQIKQLTPDEKVAKAYVQSFDPMRWQKDLKDFLGQSAVSMIELETKEKKYDVTKHAVRFEKIRSNWSEILQIIDQEIPSREEYRKLMQTIGLSGDYTKLGHSCLETRKTFIYSKDIRDKYIGSRLLWDLGRLEEVANSVF